MAPSIQNLGWFYKNEGVQQPAMQSLFLTGLTLLGAYIFTIWFISYIRFLLSLYVLPGTQVRSANGPMRPPCIYHKRLLTLSPPLRCTAPHLRLPLQDLGRHHRRLGRAGQGIRARALQSRLQHAPDLAHGQQTRRRRQRDQAEIQHAHPHLSHRLRP